MDKGGTRTDVPQNMETDNYALGFTVEERLGCQEQKVEEDTPAFRITSVLVSKNSRNIQKELRQTNYDNINKI